MHASPLDPLWIIPKRISNFEQSSLCIPKWSIPDHHLRMEQWWERARRAMKDRNVTQADVAEHFSMTPAGMQKWLSGGREPSLSDLLRLADFLKVSRSWLLLGADAADDIGDLPDFAQPSLRHIAQQTRDGNLDAEWFQRFELAVEALGATRPARARLDYRSAALGLATALDLQEHEARYMLFVKKVDEIVTDKVSTSEDASQPTRALGS